MYERLLVPLDGSPLAESVLPHAEEIATRFGSRVILLRVAPSLASFMAETIPGGGLPTAGAEAELGVEVAEKEYQVEQQSAGSYLDGIAARFTAKGLKADKLVREGPPGGVILETAHEQNANLIAMSTHGRTGIARTVLGSVADEVVRASHLPVLLIHP